MMHDCALTEEYFIFLDMPLCFEPEVRLRLGFLRLRSNVRLPWDRTTVPIELQEVPVYQARSHVKGINVPWPVV